MQNIITALLNTLFVGIPEEFIWVTFVLVLIKRFDLLDWKRWKRNIKFLSIPIISVACSINFFKYVFNLPQFFIRIITLIMLFTLIIYISNKTDRIRNNNNCKIVLFTLLGALIIAIIETLYMPIILYITNLRMCDINYNPSINFWLSLPVRLIQGFVLFYVIYNNNFKTKYSYFKLIFKNKLAIVSTFILLTMIILGRLSSASLFDNEGIFRTLSIENRIMIGTDIIVLPTLFFMIMIITNLYYIHKNIQIEEKYSHMLDDID